MLSRSLSLISSLCTPFLQQKGVYILAYHSINKNPNAVIDVTPNLLEEQLNLLKEEGYVFISINDIEKLKQNDGKYVVLTFDDGYEDFYTEAIPILTKFDAPATVYAITKHLLDPQIPFTFSAGKGKKSMTVKQAQDLEKSPLFTVGAHTHTHPNLALLNAVEIEKEMVECKRILFDVLGRNEIDFCYPWGAYNANTTAVAQKYYQTAVIGKGGINSLLSYNPLELRRIPIKNESLINFHGRIKQHSILEDWLRDLYVKMRTS